LIGAPGTSLSAGVPGSLLGAEAPVGSPQPRTPAGVFVPSAPINECFQNRPSAQLINQKSGEINVNDDFMVLKIDGKIPAKSGNSHISQQISGFFPVKLYIFIKIKAF
jgi:hypothetical protein